MGGVMAQQPMYQQIAEELRRRIELGELAPGEQLPTELELREAYDASRNTIRDAIKRLASLGLVETKPGQGTFVTRKIDPFVTVLTQDAGTGLGGGEGATYLSQVAREKRTPSVSGLKVEMQTAPQEIRQRLGSLRGTRWSYVTKSASSTGSGGRCKRRITPCPSSPTAALPGY